MNNDLLGDCRSLQALRRWMNEAGLGSLGDISVRQDSCWASWNLETPPDLYMEREVLLSKLHGLDPTLIRKQEFRGWGV